MIFGRRFLTFIALAVFMIAVIGYLFWIPYDPASLYRAIPADAALISSHQNLGQRWPQLATNIWLNPLFGAEEISGQTPDSQGRARQPVGPLRNGGTTPLAWQAGSLPRLERGPALPTECIQVGPDSLSGRRKNGRTNSWSFSPAGPMAC